MPNAKKKAPKSNNRIRLTPTTQVPAHPGHRKITIAPIDAHHLPRMTQQAPTNGQTTAPRAPHTTSNLSSIAASRTGMEGRDIAWLARTITWGMARLVGSGRARIISRSCGMTTRRVICGDDVAFVFVVCQRGEESEVNDACFWARSRGLRIIWNEMQSLMIGLNHCCCHVRSTD